MKPNNFLCLLLFSASFLGQNTTAGLEPAPKDGLQRIYLPGEITSFSRPDFGDLRIYDHNGTEVPYAFPAPASDGANYKFRPFAIISKTAVPKKTTSVVVENTIGKIEEITLYIANVDVTKKFSISGSDNREQWFGLVNTSELSDIRNSRSTSEYKSIPLPLTSYRYLRIDFDDKKTVPVNVLEAGYFESSGKTAQLYESVQPAKMEIIQDKPNKQTLIRVSFNHPEYVHRIGFGISAPNSYNRQAMVYKNTARRVKRRKQTYKEELARFELVSGKANRFDSFNLFETVFFIAIDNRDNPPLTISDITFSQKKVYVVADLKAGEMYTVQTGDPKRSKPDYDLSDTNPEISDSLPEARITAVTHEKTIEKTSEIAFWQQPWFLWVCIALGTVAILYFSASLIRDMKSSNKKP